MTKSELLDWFAGMTLQALLADNPAQPSAIAQDAYAYARAMMEERDNHSEETVE